MTYRLSELVPSASLRRELTLQAFVQDLVPPVLCYFASAVLVQIPRTFTIRLALLPITIWTAFRAGTQLDLVKGYPHEKRLAYVNQQFTVSSLERGSFSLKLISFVSW